MTITNTGAVNVFVGNGVATSFSTTIYAQTNADVVVLSRVAATGAETPLVLDVDYSISGLFNSVGVTITYPLSGSPLPATDELVAYRDVPYTQLTDIQNQDGFSPEVVENGLDTLVMQIQQLAAQLSRSIYLPPGDVGLELPTLENRRNQALVFDNDGNFSLIDINNVSIAISAYWQGILTQADKATSDTARGLAEVLYSNITNNLTTGYSSSQTDLGTGSGTVTLNYANGHFQTITNAGGFTLNPPATSGHINLLITNAAGAGSISLNGWDVADAGSLLTTGASDQFMCLCAVNGSASVLSVVALQ